MSINFGGLGSPVKEIEGGTNATTFDQARTNMGLNPTFTPLTLTYNAVAADRGKFFHYTGPGVVDFTLDPAATLTNTWSCFLRNDAGGNITINPNGGELINGAATLALEPGSMVTIFCSGTAFYTEGQATAVDGANVNLSNLGVTAINASLIPSADNTRDLGTTTTGWRDIYTRTVDSPTTGGLALSVWNTGTLSYDAILAATVGNPPAMALASTLTATTQAPLSANTRLATCAYVDSAVSVGAGAPTNATYITQTPSAGLSAEQAMSTLATGLVKNTTATGVQSIAVNGTDYYGPGTPTPVPVTDGGLGVATLTTPYGVLCAGTTATSPVQTLASLGTAGYVLTSNGAGALPSFQANAGGSGGWVLLATVTAASTTNIDFTTNINSTYDEYRIIGTNLKNATSGADIQMRISIASSFQTGAFYNYGYGYFSSAGANATGAATGTFAQMSVSGIGVSTSSNRVYGFEFALKSPADTASYKICQWNLGYSRVTTEVTQVTEGMSVFTNSAAAVDGVRFYNSSGAVTSGVYYLYGIKK